MLKTNLQFIILIIKAVNSTTRKRTASSHLYETMFYALADLKAINDLNNIGRRT